MKLIRRKEKLKRRDNYITVFTRFFYNWGGHMPFVPMSCTHNRVFAQKQEDGKVRWIDNGICNTHCKDKCDRWKQYWNNGGKEEHSGFVNKSFKNPRIKKK